MRSDEVYRKEMENLFLPSLEGVAEVMKEQLRLAGAKGCNVKVVTTRQSPYKAHLIPRESSLWAALDNLNHCSLT